MSYALAMPIKASKLQRALERAGCVVENKRSGSGHKTVRNGKLKTDLPFHGGGQEIGEKLLKKILKSLNLDKNDLDL